MRVFIFATSALAFLYASPVLGIALAIPRAQDEVNQNFPGAEITTNVPEQMDPEAGSGQDGEQNGDGQDGDQQNENQQNGDQQNGDGNSGVDNNAVDETITTIETPDPGADSSIPDNPIIRVNLGPDDTSASANLTSSSGSNQTEAAMAEYTASEANAGQTSNTIAVEFNRATSKLSLWDMEPEFMGPRGKLEAHMADLGHEDGQLEGGLTCQQHNMVWVDPDPRDEVTLTLGATFVLGEAALLYRDKDCKDRIDEGEEWPSQEYQYSPGDPVPFWFTWIELDRDQLFGFKPMPDGTTLTPLASSIPPVA
ncbi:hypothetical protein H072_10607 [Dactylellina haptotyla CBS 200.50]|uniref:Uncharacterized protein n=1 Tax=Dactylellina haptotyla (strain CBS 200.50) TaxID=1284197 RepID=S8BL39_DACHA|nr:hypothetical protein H072_10607 [Dactylellina haptotyla CBS 200.50]